LLKCCKGINTWWGEVCDAKIWVAIMYGDFKWVFNYMMGIGHNPFQEIQEMEMKQSSPK
jgi:hypothetical protein